MVSVYNDNKIFSLQLASNETKMIRFKKDKGILPYTNTMKVSPLSIIAGGMYLLSGRSDKEWINQYNHSLTKDKDKNPYFHYSDGERLKYWNRLNENHFVYNPQDQLIHTYEQIYESAKVNCYPVMQLYNPLFDSELGKNSSWVHPVSITFSWINKELSMFVHFRSVNLTELIDDYLFNLSMIHHILISWLNQSDNIELRGKVKCGDLTLYIDDFHTDEWSLPDNFYSYSEPKMMLSIVSTLNFIDVYYDSLDHLFESPELTSKSYKNIIKTTDQIYDDFFHDMVLSLCASKLLDNYAKSMEIKDLDKAFEVLGVFRSDWNIPVYASLFKDSRIMIPDHLTTELKRLDGDIQGRVKNFEGEPIAEKAKSK